MNLEDFLEKVNGRLDFEKTKAILETLNNHEKLNLDELSIKSKVNRSSLAKFLAPLELLGYVEHYKIGVAKYCKITELGEQNLKNYFYK